METKLSRWICQKCHRVAGIHVEGANIVGETRVAFCCACDSYTEQKLEKVAEEEKAIGLSNHSVGH